jgi:hypothetical protein
LHKIGAAFAPYGYLKDPENKNHLILDEEIVPIKREILQWFIRDGMSLNGIAKRLNELGIPNPTAYKRSKGWNYQNPHAQENDGLWVGSTVRRMLENRVNLGHLVQGRQRVVSYKVHDRVAVAPEDWYVAENTHEACLWRSLETSGTTGLQLAVRRVCSWFGDFFLAF